MNKILKATKLYQELKEEFEKGDPNSELNRACNSIDDLAVYAMIRYANQANDATDTNGTCAIGDVGVSLPSANDIQKEAERYQDKSGNQMAIERIAFAQGGLWIRMLWEKSLRQ